MRQETLKKRKNRVRMTICGDKLDYLNDEISPVTSLSEMKLFLNIAIPDADQGMHFMSLYVKGLYLNTLMIIR